LLSLHQGRCGRFIGARQPAHWFTQAMHITSPCFCAWQYWCGSGVAQPYAVFWYKRCPRLSIRAGKTFDNLVSASRLQSTPFHAASVLGTNSKHKMPIVGPAPSTGGTVTSVQTIDACGTFASTRYVSAQLDSSSHVKDRRGLLELARRTVLEESWWHSTVFTTSPTEFTSFNVPDLTTIYEYSVECVDRWMLAPVVACNSGNLTVFSVDPARSIVSDPLYRSCQKYSTPIYNPGVCPRGYSMAEITAILSSIQSGNKTFWSASCCRRFDHTSPSTMYWSYQLTTSLQWHDNRPRVREILH
jgi:hypothetical protein